MIQPFKKPIIVAKSRKMRSPKKRPFSFLLTLLGVVVIALGLVSAYYLVFMPQDIRNQASTGGSCQYKPVNVQFRKHVPNTDNPWVDGTSIGAFKTGEKLDVNCFASNGSRLLPGGKFTVMKDGKVVTLPASTLQSATQVKALTITEAGTYSFTCSNTSSCTNADSVVVTAATTTPPATTPPATTPPATNPPATNPPVYGACANPSVADLNKDCRVDLLDYDIFLREFISRM